MPIYEYRSLCAEECPFAECRGHFEELQDLEEAALEHCPACGIACERVISRPALKRYDRGTSGILNPDNIARHNFTQYKKAGKGCWEKQAGEGPRYLHRGSNFEERF